MGKRRIGVTSKASLYSNCFGEYVVERRKVRAIDSHG